MRSRSSSAERERRDEREHSRMRGLSAETLREGEREGRENDKRLRMKRSRVSELGESLAPCAVPRAARDEVVQHVRVEVSVGERIVG